MKPAPVLLSLALAALNASAAPVWHQDGNRSLELRDGESTLIRFRLDCAPLDPHFEILATPDGRNTVWVGPDDHVWHYGLWFSWKFINGVNFWETDKASRIQQGRSKITGPRIDSSPQAATATIQYRDLAHPDPDGPAVLEDRVTITLTRPQNGRGPQVDWHITTTALADVKLDRTPLPDEPGGKPYGGYGGFSWRGAKPFKDMTFTDSEGRENMDLHRKHARWVGIGGTLDGKPAGLAVIDHPQNPGHPASWFLANTPEQPFWFLNSAIVQPKPVTLQKGQTLTHAYRVFTADAPLDAAAIVAAAPAGKP